MLCVVRTVGVGLERAAVRAGKPAVAVAEQNSHFGRKSTRRGEDLCPTLQAGQCKL